MAKNRLYKTYPFPYLSEDTKDYKKTQFILMRNYAQKDGNMVFDLSYSINNDYLNGLIKDGTIRVAIKLSCSILGFTRVYSFRRDANSTKVVVPISQLDGDISITAYLVANNEFVLNNDDLNDFWIKEKPTVQENNIIGESNETIMHVDHVKSGATKSIFQFTIARDKDDDAPFDVNYSDENCLVFRLSNKSFKLFDSIRTKYPRAIHVTFIIPVISDILRQMINPEKDDDGNLIPNEFNSNHSHKRWYKTILDNYMQAYDGNTPFDGVIPPLTAAQAIIDRFAVNDVLITAKKSIN